MSSVIRVGCLGEVVRFEIIRFRRDGTVGISGTVGDDLLVKSIMFIRRLGIKRGLVTSGMCHGNLVNGCGGGNRLSSMRIGPWL